MTYMSTTLGRIEDELLNSFIGLKWVRTNLGTSKKECYCNEESDQMVEKKYF